MLRAKAQRGRNRTRTRLPSKGTTSSLASDLLHDMELRFRRDRHPTLAGAA